MTLPEPASFGQERAAARPVVDLDPHFAALPVEPFFCDWLTIYQTHNWDLPVIDAGLVMAVDRIGEIVWKVTKPLKLEGSFSTGVNLRCDGRTVYLSGNISRFGRADNLWGLSLAQTIRKASAIVGRFGLPPFTAGQEHLTFRMRNGPAWRNRRALDAVAAQREARVAIHREAVGEVAYTGARIGRLDMTANFATGSLENAKEYMRWLHSQQHSRRVKVGTFDNMTVDWGRGSKRVYAKAYLKSGELRRGNGPTDLIRYCEDLGIVRFEVTVKSTQLGDMGCQYLGGLHMGHLIQLFEDRRQVMTRATLDVDDLSKCQSRALRLTARDYLAGMDLTATLPERTFRRHRAGLLPYGIDIAVAHNVRGIAPRVRVIEVSRVDAPSWYELDRDAA